MGCKAARIQRIQAALDSGLFKNGDIADACFTSERHTRDIVTSTPALREQRDSNRRMNIMHKRERLVDRVQYYVNGGFSISHACRQVGVGRRTYYDALAALEISK